MKFSYAESEWSDLGTNVSSSFCDFVLKSVRPISFDNYIVMSGKMLKLFDAGFLIFLYKLKVFLAPGSGHSDEGQGQTKTAFDFCIPHVVDCSFKICTKLCRESFYLKNCFILQGMVKYYLIKFWLQNNTE